MWIVIYTRAPPVLLSPSCSRRKSECWWVVDVSTCPPLSPWHINDPNKVASHLSLLAPLLSQITNQDLLSSRWNGVLGDQCVTMSHYDQTSKNNIRPNTINTPSTVQYSTVLTREIDSGTWHFLLLIIWCFHRLRYLDVEQESDIKLTSTKFLPSCPKYQLEVNILARRPATELFHVTDKFINIHGGK